MKNIPPRTLADLRKAARDLEGMLFTAWLGADNGTDDEQDLEAAKNYARDITSTLRNMADRRPAEAVAS